MNSHIPSEKQLIMQREQPHYNLSQLIVREPGHALIACSGIRTLPLLSLSGESFWGLAEHAEADLSFIQLIESTRRQAKAQRKSITLSLPAKGNVLKVLERAGFLDAFNSDDLNSGCKGATP
ncbi:hypothetical protein J2W42_002791 [Rhizobium tibeticum]|nr:hypothetical protein [Rhizobium tibeticum]